MPDDSVLAELYPKNYYSYQDFFDQRSPLRQQLTRLLLPGLGTKDPRFDKPGSMLDLGCGSGQFMYKMRELGWKTQGVEISRDAAELGRKVANLDIFAGTLIEASLPGNSFNYVRSNHSFEHIYNPHDTLNEIYRILTPGGKLLVGVPNIDSLNARLFKKYWWYLGVPVHTFSYSPQTLSQMLESHGFVIDKIAFNSDYSGILGSIQIYLNRNTNKPSTEGVFFNSRLFRTISHLLANGVDLFRQGDAIEITAHKS